MKGLAEANQRGKGVHYRKLAKGAAPSAQLPLQSPLEWAKAIRRLWERGPANTIELAKMVAVAKRRLAYGEWTQLWKLGTIPFSKRKADMLATVGKGLAGLDRQTSAHLPTGWNTLYYLSFLDLRTLRKFVRPMLTLRDAKELLAKYRGQKPKESSRRGYVKLRIRKFREFVRSTLGGWSAAERELVRAELLQLAQHIGEFGKASRFRQAASDAQSRKPAIGNVNGALPRSVIPDNSWLGKPLTEKLRSAL